MRHLLLMEQEPQQDTHEPGTVRPVPQVKVSPSQKTAAHYRQLAGENRRVAQQISLSEPRDNLLAAAAELDRLANELEAQGAMQALRGKAAETSIERIARHRNSRPSACVGNCHCSRSGLCRSGN
jgi:hypothetical protein